jgi:hypothetical protein
LATGILSKKRASSRPGSIGRHPAAAEAFSRVFTPIGAGHFTVEAAGAGPDNCVGVA